MQQFDYARISVSKLGTLQTQKIAKVQVSNIDDFVKSDELKAIIGNSESY